MDGQRGPTLANATTLLVVLVVLAINLVSAPRSSPPAIAEIASQAVQQITEAPPEQAVELDEEPTDDEAEARDDVEGDGEDGEGEQPGPESTEPPEIDQEASDELPSQFSCVGDPLRQTEDPQSPPCVPFWDAEADNGGATTPGVSGDEIRVVVPSGSSTIVPALEAYFNTRYNFYGRRLKLIDTSQEREAALTNPVQGQLDAARSAKNQHDAFASSDFWYSGGVIYMRELAQLGVVGVSAQSIIAEKDLASAHPFLWQYPMATDRQLSMLGEWACARFVPGTADRAGPRLQGADRVLGAIVIDDYRPSDYGVNGKTDITPLENELASCLPDGLAETARIDLTAQQASQFPDAVLKMAAAGVTSVICVCDSDPLDQVMSAASAQAYVPEWLLPTHTENEHVWLKRGYDGPQAQAMMGLQFVPTNLDVYQDPWYWAANEGSPGVTWDLLGNESSYSRQAFYHPSYRSLLVIAAGIQMAGPNLTPETFAQGLQQTRFPNPEVGIRAGAVGFDDGDHSMTQDAAEYWWSPSEVGPYGPGGFSGQGAGTTCFGDQAARRSRGQWAAVTSRFGEGGCFTGAELAYEGS